MAKLHLIADELGNIRALIRTLKAREDVLRERLLTARLNGPCAGADWEVTIRRSTRRCFLTDRLPAQIREDPSYWETRPTETVIARPKNRRSGDMVVPGDVLEDVP